MQSIFPSRCERKKRNANEKRILAKKNHSDIGDKR